MIKLFIMAVLFTMPMFAQEYFHQIVLFRTGTTVGDLAFQDADGDMYVGFKPPDIVTTSVLWQLPPADGNADEFIQTDGMGVLTFSTAYVQIQDESMDVTRRTVLNFTGYGAACVDNAMAMPPSTDCDVSGGYDTIQDEGMDLPMEHVLNFTGNGITCVDNAMAMPPSTDCDVSSGYNTVEDEGTPLTQRQTINFTGAGITCIDSASPARTDCNVPSSAAGLVHQSNASGNLTLTSTYQDVPSVSITLNRVGTWVLWANVTGVATSTDDACGDAISARVTVNGTDQNIYMTEGIGGSPQLAASPFTGTVNGSQVVNMSNTYIVTTAATTDVAKIQGKILITCSASPNDIIDTNGTNLTALWVAP